MMSRTAGIKYGTHRVIEPKGVLPQAALRLDNSLPIHPTEILIDVEVLNVDSASFTQLKSEAKGSEQGVADLITKTVSERGKQHNPVTGSGGMLTGRIREIGSEYRGRVDAKVGEPIATLVSLTLTPLKLDRIKRVHLDREQVEVEGYAILFESGVAVRLPADFSRDAALAILDVAGAPAQTIKLVKKGMEIGIIGTGKSGLLCAAMARKIIGNDGRITGIARREESVIPLKEWGYIDDYVIASAHDPVEVFERVHEKTSGRLFDLVLNTTNTPNTEMATILSVKDGGTAYFFNMATSFTAAALGAEGIGKAVTLLIGNGYLPDHAKISLDLVREDEILKKYFEEKYT